jgi:hypothetical protein
MVFAREKEKTMTITNTRTAHCKITFDDHETVEFDILSHHDGRMIADDQIPGFLSFIPADSNEMISFRHDLIAAISLSPPHTAP